MHGPDISRSPVPNVALLVAAALSLWGAIYLSASVLWPKRPAGPPVETTTTQLAKAPVRPRAQRVKRVKLAKPRRRAWSGRSLASRTFATNTMH
jgi:hypothetical protein